MTMWWGISFFFPAITLTQSFELAPTLTTSATVDTRHSYALSSTLLSQEAVHDLYSFSRDDILEMYDLLLINPIILMPYYLLVSLIEWESFKNLALVRLRQEVRYTSALFTCWMWRGLFARIRLLQLHFSNGIIFWTRWPPRAATDLRSRHASSIRCAVRWRAKIRSHPHPVPSLRHLSKMGCAWNPAESIGEVGAPIMV